MMLHYPSDGSWESFNKLLRKYNLSSIIKWINHESSELMQDDGSTTVGVKN